MLSLKSAKNEYLLKRLYIGALIGWRFPPMRAQPDSEISYIKCISKRSLCIRFLLLTTITCTHTSVIWSRLTDVHLGIEDFSPRTLGLCNHTAESYGSHILFVSRHPHGLPAWALQMRCHHGQLFMSKKKRLSRAACLHKRELFQVAQQSSETPGGERIQPAAQQ